jgi:hypothetical protein
MKGVQNHKIYVENPISEISGNAKSNNINQNNLKFNLKLMHMHYKNHNRCKSNFRHC